MVPAAADYGPAAPAFQPPRRGSRFAWEVGAIEILRRSRDDSRRPSDFAMSLVFLMSTLLPA